LLLLFFERLPLAHHIRNAAATKPQLTLQHKQQGDQHEVEWAQRHG
jgi:hypothetical protein